MKAVFIEEENCFYYGETSLNDPNKYQGKGILVFKNGYNSLYECWWVNDKRKGKGRMIDKTECIYDGEWANGKKNGYGVHTYKSGSKHDGLWLND